MSGHSRTSNDLARGEIAVLNVKIFIVIFGVTAIMFFKGMEQHSNLQLIGNTIAVAMLSLQVTVQPMAHGDRWKGAKLDPETIGLRNKKFSTKTRKTTSSSKTFNESWPNAG